MDAHEDPDQGKISQEQYDDAVAAPLDLDLHPKNQGCTAAEDAPYFCTYVENEILTSPEFGETPDGRLNNLQRGGLKIVTTLDPKAQSVAQEQVEATQPADDNPDSVGSSIVSVEPDSGNIVAMAQNSNYSSAEEEDHQNTVYNFNTDTLDAGTGDDASANEELPCTLDGEEITVAFNPSYLSEGLSVVDQPQVRFSFTSAPKPALLTGVAEKDGVVSDYRYLVMPVRLT